jgi:hypothetical protein
MNIQMRIITEDNIDQLTNLCYQSRNIDKLLHIEPGDLAERNIKEIIENYKSAMNLKIIETEFEKKKVKKNRDEANVLQLDFNALPVGPMTPSMSPPIDDNVLPPLNNPTFGPRTPSMSPPIDHNVSPPYAPGSPAYNPSSDEFKPEYDPDSPPFNPSSSQSGGSINLFSDPNTNAAFNMLNGSSQSKILLMEPNEREIIMREIIKKSGRQENVLASSNHNSNQNDNDNVLEPYFNALPVGKQLEVLKGGYQSMSKEFSKLEGKIEDPLITIKKPISIQEELTKQHKKYITLCPTNKSARIVKGKTIHKFICESKGKMNKSKDVDYVFVDEISMLSCHFYKYLVTWKRANKKTLFFYCG